MQANARYVHLRPNMHRKYIFFKFVLRHNYSLKTDRQTDRQTGMWVDRKVGRQEIDS